MICIDPSVLEERCRFLKNILAVVEPVLRNTGSDKDNVLLRILRFVGTFPDPCVRLDARFYWLVGNNRLFRFAKLNFPFIAEPYLLNSSG